jgi:acyl carrier protein
MTTEEKVLNVLSVVFNKPADTLNGDSSPDTIEEWDSIMHINLVLAIEEEFGVKFTDEEILEMMNVSLIVMALKEKGK